MGFSRQEYWSGLPADHKTKSHRSEVSSSLILCNNELFLDQIVTCDKKWILHNNWQWPAQWLNWEAPKHFPKPSLHQKNSNGHCLVIWSTTSFQIPAKPLHLRSMRSKSMKCTENCNACRQHWSIGCAQFFHVSHNQCSKDEWIGLLSFASSFHLTSPQPTTSSSSSSIFCRENVSTTSRTQKMLSKCLSNSEAQIFTPWNKLISHWQKCVGCNGSHFD